MLAQGSVFLGDSAQLAPDQQQSWTTLTTKTYPNKQECLAAHNQDFKTTGDTETLMNACVVLH